MAGLAQTSSVTGSITLVTAKGSPRKNSDTGIVVWMTPLTRSLSKPGDRARSAHPRIVQRNKRFDTRLLAVEVGTTVDFPNDDPFFHNVFSRFDGRQFDLGLYEAGKTKGVQFNRAGVCYIFCNIHSEMSTVVVVVDTPYFVKLNAPGEYRFTELPAGQYQLNVWAERCAPETLKASSRLVTVGSTPTTIPAIVLPESRDRVVPHANKYGRDYETPVFSSPVYVRP